jgi:hypothetical protein
MEDELKIFKVEYLSNHGLDLTPNMGLKLTLPNQTLKMLQIKMTSNRSGPQNIKMGYTSNH